MEDLTPVHVGLMGHIDHGKTELARALSEEVSTAGLDKHPQSKRRGITIDLGFTMFKLNGYLVTLVDAPGHADLIRSVVAGAGIIDAAILTVAADEGPKVQTGEHLVVLEAMGVNAVLIVITKIDLVSEVKAQAVEEKMRIILETTCIENVDYVRVSAKTGTGIDGLRKKLLTLITPPVRQKEGQFLMPVDHAFSVRGHGTVTTGTILSGKVAVGGTVTVMPSGMKTRVRSLQTFREERATAAAGDRVGMNIPDISAESLSRGDYICNEGILKKSDAVIITLMRNALYKGRITAKMVVSATIGMPSVTAEVIPFTSHSKGRVMLKEVDAKQIQAIVLASRSFAVRPGMRALLMRTDLPPTQMRIIGSGEVTDILTHPTILRRQVRTGHVSRIRKEDVLVERLASRKEVAEQISGAEVRTKSGVTGTITKPFGTRGVVSVRFNNDVQEGEEVYYETLKEEVLYFGH